MHTAISCATCARPLRISSELLGQTVRCPFCTDEFIAVADPTIKLEEKAPQSVAASVEEPRREAGLATLLEADQPVVEEEFTVDLSGPEKPPAPLPPWTTAVFVRNDSDRRLWGQMKAEISSEGVLLQRGRKVLLLPVGCEATWVGGGVVRVVVGSRQVEFTLKKKHIYKSRLAKTLTAFLNGDGPMPVNKGYGWPWYQWLLLLAPLALIGVLIFGELPDTNAKTAKGFGIFLLATLVPAFAYALWHWERLSVALRWTAMSLLLSAAFTLTAAAYYFDAKLPPAAATANWTTLSPDEGRFAPRFRVLMPAPPLTDNVASDGLQLVRSRARLQPDQTFTVAYADIPWHFNGNNQWERNNVFSRGRQCLESLYPRWLYMSGPQHILLDEEYLGQEYIMVSSRQGGGIITVHLYLVDTRLYFVFVETTLGSNNAKFLDSFHIENP